MATAFAGIGTRLQTVGLLFAVATSQLEAQGAADQSAFRSRPYLDSVATSLERSGKKDEAAAIRERLRIGDFYPGERLVVEVFGGEEPFRDTVAVRTNQEVNISSYPAFSLRGVLRSEVDSVLLAQIKRYIQRPTLRTQPLMRVLVTGAVGRPGWVVVRSDAAVSEVVSAAGGLTTQSKLNKSKIKRGDATLVSADSLSLVFRTGMTLDQADFRAGDEIAIAEKKQSNFTQVLWAASAALGVVISIISLTR